jgi:hypothetical protein
LPCPDLKKYLSNYFCFVKPATATFTPLPILVPHIGGHTFATEGETFWVQLVGTFWGHFGAHLGGSLVPQLGATF